MTIVQFLKNHTILTVLVALLIVILIIGWKYLGIVIIAASLAVVGMPLYRYLHRKLPGPFASFIVTTLITAIIVSILSAVVVSIVTNIDILSNMINSIIEWITLYFGGNAVSFTADDIFSGIMQILSPEMALSAISGITFAVMASILFYSFLYLFFIFGDRIVADIWSILPLKSRPGMKLMGEKTRDILYSLYVVHVLMAVITFGAAIVYCLFLFGITVDECLLYATLCGIFALIPVVGPIVVIVFIALYYFSIGAWYELVITLTVGYFLTCILTDMILRPKLTGKRVRIRPMLIFVGFFGGAAVMGILGFVLGPILLVLGITGYELFFREMRCIREEIDSCGGSHVPAPADGEKQG